MIKEASLLFAVLFATGVGISYANTAGAPTLSPAMQKLIAQNQNLVARIEPFGKVCYDADNCDISITSLAATVDGEPRDGKTIYEAVCSTCHGTGVMGAPALGDSGAWAPRIAKGKDALHNSALNGVGAMPAKGGADLPDEEVINAVDYIIAQSS